MQTPQRSKSFAKPVRNTRGAKTCSGRTQRGVTLIEALITLFVLSVGLLGMAALQLVSIQENSSAFRHTQAIWFANDMADRMRANMVGVAGNSYDNVDTSTAPLAQSCTSSCTPTQIASMDIYEWDLQIKTLPGGFGTVTSDGGSPERFLIQVRWQDDITNIATTAPHRVSAGCPSDPNIAETCVEITIQP